MARRRWLIATTVTASGLLACVAASAASPLPRLTTATVLGDRVTLNFSGALRPGAGGWTIVVNGAPVKAKSVAYSPKRLQLILPRSVFGDDTIRVVGRNLRSKSGARLKLVDTKPVNKSPAGCTRELGTVAKGVAAEGPTDTDTFLSPSRFRVLTVQVDYADAPANAFDGQVPLAPVESWVRELSYGRATVTGTAREGVVRMFRNFGDYARSGPWDGQKGFFQELVARLDPEVDFAQYDTILVVTATKGVTRTTGGVATLAPAGAGVVADGKELRHFGFTRTPIDAVRTLLQLAGLPEIGGGYAGGWDPMGYRTGNPGLLGMLAWHRRKLGWLDPSQVRCLGAEPLEVTLAPMWSAGGVKAVVAQTGKTTAIVLENRQPRGLDAAHCRKGILTYEVRTEWQYHLWVIAKDWTYDPKCEALDAAPYDFRPKDSTRIQGAVTFEVIATEADGSYRLRVTR
jgi:hypothetical protein